MVDVNTFQQLALSFPDAEEQPHFEKTSFRVKNKIFATLDKEKGLACLMLSLIDQSVFCTYDKEIIYPVPNKWGQKGATFVVLDKVKKEMLKDALGQAYNKLTAKKSA
jgi:predicted DNA-binding protein (MmcQ/YjbR family)